MDDFFGTGIVGVLAVLKEETANNLLAIIITLRRLIAEHVLKEIAD